ncbi:protein-L-isoaspartate O-methyltransferase family protein [Devosia sp. CAU 1758]
MHTSSVTDPALLAVFRTVPRELFVPADRRELAYSDAAHPLGKGRFLPAPAVFGRLVQLAEIADTDRVLECAPGSGYSIAILAGLAREVLGLESDADMAALAQSNLAALAISNATIVNADFRTRDLNTFDVIIIEGAVDQVPPELLEILSVGGRLVCLVRRGPVGVATVHIRKPEGVVTHTSFNATLPPLTLAPAPEIFVF